VLVQNAITVPPQLAERPLPALSLRMDDLSTLLATFPVIIEVPVAWGDMDAFGHVNNTVFFRYFESARIEYLERLGFRGEAGEPGIGPILASTQCRFRRPLAYPDTVLVGARVSLLGDDRFTHEYRLVSRAWKEIAAEGTGIVVAYDYTSRAKCAIPAAVRARIEALEGAAGK
jgi:acyl-CoA thioester hydrolase